MKDLIGTHNSGTGEPSYKWYHKLLIPFARCQGKTILEQRNMGCEYFDLRVYREKNGNYRICHGLWRSSRCLKEIMLELGYDTQAEIYVQLTIENKDVDSDLFEGILNELEGIIQNYGGCAVHLTQINHKSRDGWKVLRYYVPSPHVVQGFLPLDGHSWHTYLPIPWLWKKIYNSIPKWSNEFYTLVDFLGG